MNTVSVAAIQKIAKSKGLRFMPERNGSGYAMHDALTGQVLMLYAPVTLSNITDPRVWRRECNILKALSA